MYVAPLQIILFYSINQTQPAKCSEIMAKCSVYKDTVEDEMSVHLVKVMNQQLKKASIDIVRALSRLRFTCTHFDMKTFVCVCVCVCVCEREGERGGDRQR